MNHLQNMPIDIAIKKVIQYNNQGISVFLTFSRYNLDKKSLSDERSNTFLKEFSSVSKQNMNGVIISNDMLCDIVKEKYNNLLTVSSILKPTYESNNWTNDDYEYYNSLAEKYDYVVPNPSKIVQHEFRKNIDFPEKMIVLLNSKCTVNCTMAKFHYEYQSLIDDAIINGDDPKEYEKKLFQITHKCSNSIGPYQTVNIDKIESFINDKFINFKFDGREYDGETLVQEVDQYIIELNKYRT